jgi:hypothetical protein
MALDLYLEDIQADPHCIYAYLDIDDLLENYHDVEAWEEALEIIEDIADEFPEHEDAAAVRDRIREKLEE